MSNSDRMRLWAPVLLAAATMVGGVLASPASAQRVEVFVNGQRVADVVINGAVGHGANGAQFLNGANGTRFVNGANGVVNGVNGVNGTRALKGANGTRFINGANGAHVNGARAVNGANGAHFVNGANGGNGVNGANGRNGVRSGFHSHSHVGPYDECFLDRMTGQGYCTGRQWGRHSGPHRGLFQEPATAELF
jgi:hypothetical protein